MTDVIFFLTIELRHTYSACKKTAYLISFYIILTKF